MELLGDRPKILTSPPPPPPHTHKHTLRLRIYEILDSTPELSHFLIVVSAKKSWQY